MSKIDKWNSRYEKSENGPPGLPEGLSSYLTRLKTGDSLDLACGDGAVALWLADAGHQVTAVDFAEQGLIRLQQFAHVADKNITTLMLDLEAPKALSGLPLFDNIIICRFLPDEQLIRDAVQQLKPGGKLLLTTFNSYHHETSSFSRRFCLTPQQFVDVDPELMLELYIDGAADSAPMDLYLFKRI